MRSSVENVRKKTSRLRTDDNNKGKLARPPASIVWITYTHLSDTWRFENYIFPSLDTWLANTTDTYYIVMANPWKEKFEQDLCNSTSRPQWKQYCDRIQVVWVDCPEGYYGISPCCKSEKGLLSVYQQLTATNRSFDYYCYLDDDMYMRASDLQKYLAPLPAQKEAFVVTVSKSFPLGLSVFTDTLYNCSFDDNFTMPWGQPIIYSHAAMKQLAPALRGQALTKQCESFAVTHDAGNQVVHWMFSWPALQIPFLDRAFDGFFDDYWFSYADPKDSFGMHGMHRFFEADSPNLTMQDVHDFFNIETDAARQATENRVYRWHNATGFQSTNIFRQFGEPTTWKDQWNTLPTSDCFPVAANPFDSNHSL